MKYSNYFKLFALVLFLAAGMFLQGFAEIHYNNTLSKIVIDEAQNNNFNVNLIFEEQFNGNAFLQKRQNGSYYIYIPDAYEARNGVKVLYRDIKNKPNIKLNVEESVYKKVNDDSSYIKISVDILGNYTIQLFSKTVEQLAENPVKYQFNKNLIIGYILLFLAGLCLLKVILASRKNQKINRGVSSPVYSYITKPSVQPEIETEVEDKKITLPDGLKIPLVKEISIPDTHILPKVNIKKSMKPSEGEAFSCFDLPFVGDKQNEMSAEDIKNTMEQTSLIQKEKLAKITNPIAKARKEADELALPLAEEVLPESKTQENQKNEPELLSELRITPRKGLYLTTLDDTFALFGFVDSNVFLLKKFSDLSQINLQARFYDRQKNGDLYIVKLDSYKAMIEISDTGMKELAVL